jgi:hypothetical protein
MRPLTQSAGSLENAFRFVMWAQQLHYMPSIVQIVDRWGCSRATAYRYRASLAAARGDLPSATPRGTGVPSDHRGFRGHGNRRCCLGTAAA